MSSYSSHTKDDSRFINYAENLLIPDLIAEGRKETAEDLDRLVKICRAYSEQIFDLKNEIQKRDRAVQEALKVIEELDSDAG